LDSRMIEIDELQIVKLLKDEMAWVEQDVAAFVSADAIEEHLERHTVMKVFAGVQLETQVDARRVKSVENGFPALCQLFECQIDQPWRTLRPRIDIRPRESPWEGYVRLDFQVGGSFCCQPKLVDSPYLTSRRISTNAVWSKSVEPNVIGRMDRNQLALEMGRK